MDEQNNKVSAKVSIDKLDEIYNYADRFKAIVAAYDSAKIAS